MTIEGSKAEREFLYRGISVRQFKPQFSLADFVRVKGATFENGLLKIELVREIPEAMKPRASPLAAHRPPTTVTGSRPRRPDSSGSGSAARRSARGIRARLGMEETNAADDCFQRQSF